MDNDLIFPALGPGSHNNPKMVQVPMEYIRENVPIPFSMWDTNGNLLLAQGQKLDREQIISLRIRRPVTSHDEVMRWRRSIERNLAEVMRKNHELRALESFSSNPLSERPREGVTLIRDSPMRVHIQITDPVSTWDAIHLRTSSLLHEADKSRMFLPRLEAIRAAIEAMMMRFPDESLCLLIHQTNLVLDDYSTHHSILATSVAWLVAQHLNVTDDERDLVLRASLTMNIGMTRLQNRLALQDEPLTVSQREEILAHPSESVRVLKACGVQDKRWLMVVEDHHETNDGKGYPAGKRDFELGTPSKIIHQADLFSARLSPRKGRSALAANLAARQAYLGADGQPDMIGAALVKKLGIYPPGSFVHLASGELAIVVRRGLMVNTPRAAALTNPSGISYVKPLLRETIDKAYEIRYSVPADQVKVLISRERLVGLAH